MELRQLRYFLAILEAGSLSRAAGHLHVAQPALTQQIKKLEAELDSRLLVRTTRGVTPTAAGRRLAGHAREILQQIERARRDAQVEAGDLAGVVAVGLPWSLHQWLGLPLIDRVQRQLPQVHLRIQDGPSWWLAEQLAEGKLDCVIVFDTPADRGLALQPLFSEPLCAFGRIGTLPESAMLTPAALAVLPLWLLSRPNSIRSQIDRLFEREALTPRVSGEIDAPALLLAAVAAGHGVTVLPASSAATPHVQGKIESRGIAAPGLVRRASLGTSRLYPVTPAAEAVQQCLLDLLVEHRAQASWPAMTDDQAN